MKALTEVQKKEIISLLQKHEKEIKEKNRKNWLKKLGDIMESLGYQVYYGSSMCQGIRSGKISVIHKSKVRIYSWGSARGSFYSKHDWLEIKL
jgi:hypothetical protein